MAEEFNKNEEATPFKLSEARKKGQVAKSVELPAFLSTVVMISVLAATLTTLATAIYKGTTWWISHAHLLASNSNQLIFNLTKYSNIIAKGLFAIILAGMAASVAASIVHIGPLFSTFSLRPDFSKLNPAKGLQRIFSRKSLIEIIKLFIKLCFSITAIYLVWGYLSPFVLNVNQREIKQVLLNWRRCFFTLSYSLLLIMLFSATFDLWYSRKEFSRQMRMSKREIKDEHKRREGDPEIKAKRKKNLAELFSKASSLNRVKDADVVITNPSHVALALQYRSTRMALPIVVAKGQGLFANLIKRKARIHRIPLMRKPKLARSLLKQVKIGEAIPADRQEQVAEVYRWVISLPNHRVHD